MKVKEVLSKIYEQAGVEFDPKGLERIQDFEVPLDVDKCLDNLVSRDKAPSDPEIAEKVRGQYERHLKTHYNSKLKGLGYSDEDLQGFEESPLEENLVRAINIKEKKVEDRYKSSQSEREGELKALYEKERIEKETVLKNSEAVQQAAQRFVEEEKKKLLLKHAILSIPVDTTITQDARLALAEMGIDEILKDHDAKIVVIGGELKVVKNQSSERVLTSDKTLLGIEDLIKQGYSKKGITIKQVRPQKTLPSIPRQEAREKIIKTVSQAFINNLK